MIRKQFGRFVTIFAIIVNLAVDAALNSLDADLRGQDAGSCGVSPFARVVGGGVAAPGAWPWQISLKQPGWLCNCVSQIDRETVKQ